MVFAVPVIGQTAAVDAPLFTLSVLNAFSNAESPKLNTYGIDGPFWRAKQRRSIIAYRLSSLSACETSDHNEAVKNAADKYSVPRSGMSVNPRLEN